MCVNGVCRVTATVLACLLACLLAISCLTLVGGCASPESGWWWAVHSRFAWSSTVPPRFRALFRRRRACRAAPRRRLWAPPGPDRKGRW
jgi:hypothetical protein